MKRKSGREYLKEREAILEQLDAIEKRVTARLLFLCIRHPEATIMERRDACIKAKALIPANHNTSYIESLPFETQIEYICSIEQWIRDQMPFKQAVIEGFDK